MGGRNVVLDEEEEEYEEEEEEEEEEVSRPARGGGHDDDGEGEDDEEEEDEGPNEYEKDGFIVDDVDEEEEEEDEREKSDEERHKKKKKKRRESEDYELDEEDYVLLQDNNITGIHRPRPGNKFKRLKKAGEDSGADRSGFSDDDIEDYTRAGQHTAEEKLERRLFGDGGAPIEDNIAVEDEQLEEEEDADMVGEEDEMADFIVDEDEVDDTGAILRRKKVKKKKSRQTPGVSSSALQEAHEIFGDVDELLSLRKQTLQRDTAEFSGLRGSRLEDEFEPLILSEKYMTPKDDMIRETDVPERIQTSEELTGPQLDEKRIEEESIWIYNQLTGDKFSIFSVDDHVSKGIHRDDIFQVLIMQHVHKLDIPFIAMYRKELCSSLLSDYDADKLGGPKDVPGMKWHKLLWAVQNLDRKWLLLQKRKTALKSYYSKRFEEQSRKVYDENRLALDRKLFKSINEALLEARSEREVDDVDKKFNLHFPVNEADIEGQFKRAPRKLNFYDTCHKAGLWEVANKFGFDSEQFGENLTLTNISSTELQDGKEMPEEVASNFTCSMFEAPQDVLKGARHMAAIEIGLEPTVRKHVRGIYMKEAVVSTSPTVEGNMVIDPYHELEGIKWLRHKPLHKFSDAQWLLIQKAEKEKLLNVKVELPEEAKKKLMDDAKEFYVSVYVSKSANLWNEQRQMILDEAFDTIIHPDMEKEARSWLTARAKSWLLQDYGKQLWRKVSIGPFRKKDADNDSDSELEPRVMACCWGPGKPATTFVMLDSAGEVVDVLYAGSISVRSHGAAEQQRKKNDQQRVVKFMTDHQPIVACVGAANMACRQLKEELFEVIFKIVEDHPRDVSPDIERISVIFGDESLPRLYENSRISSEQLPGQPGIVKRAVALGRYLQNPLAMVATLCGPGKEILSWKLCPLDHFLSPDDKYEVIEQIMVDATNQIGVDVNLAASHEWLFAPLQFVSGLGPCKASALQKAFVRAGSIFSRKDIPVGKLVRKKVFINSVGFLRVRRSGAAAISGHIIDLLDDTRIHPESYDLAKKLAKDIYAVDAPHEPSEIDDDEQELAIEHVRDRPNMLKGLDIDEYMKSLPEEMQKRETLCDIKMELLHGFQDWRTPYTETPEDEEFRMLSGETDETLAEGRTVQVTVRGIQNNRIVCSFDSGLKAMILADDYSDDGYDPENLPFREGDIISGKIKNVAKNRFLVYLTCREGASRRRMYPARNIYDPFYREGQVSSQDEKEKLRKEKELAKKHFKPRMIVHPRFQNITADEAMEFLSDKEAGECVIRPSSKGPSFLTLTLKIFDGVYAHKEIAEEGKDRKDITSLLRLGKKLKIDKDVFEDLDEVMDRYVDPLVSHLKSMVAYRKFKRGTKAEVDDILRAEKSEYPMRIAYCFGISHEHPGTFVLTYIKSSNPHHEYIGLYPKGFRFRRKEFDNIDRLVSYFQKNFGKPPPDSGLPPRNVAAMVPLKDSTWNSDEGAYSRAESYRSSEQGPRAGGRFDSRSASGFGQGARGPGRARGSSAMNDSHDDPGSGRWPSGSKDDGLTSFSASRVQNSPGKGSISGGWGAENGSSASGAWGKGRDSAGAANWGTW